MKTIIFCLAFLFIACHCQAQAPKKDTTITFVVRKSDNVREVYTKVEKMPAYPGGEGALFKFLGSNVRYPDKAKKAGVSGTVHTCFIVDTTGKISNATIIRSSGDESLDKEALRVINSLPKWDPGRQSGVKVPVQMVVPISFTLKN